MHKRIHIAFVSAAALTALASPAAAQIMCPQIYQPVCALHRPAGPKTYANSCEADRAGATTLHDGKCVGAGETRCAQNDAFPVCGKSISTGRTKTYDNLCWAEKNWAVLVHKGKCP
jgi:hypothetical protein